jgi:hypothetical protein
MGVASLNPSYHRKIRSCVVVGWALFDKLRAKRAHPAPLRPTAASSIEARDYAASVARQQRDVREEQIAGNADDDKVDQEHDAPSEIMANNLAFIADELRR